MYILGDLFKLQNCDVGAALFFFPNPVVQYCCSQTRLWSYVYNSVIKPQVIRANYGVYVAKIFETELNLTHFTFQHPERLGSGHLIFMVGAEDYPRSKFFSSIREKQTIFFQKPPYQAQIFSYWSETNFFGGQNIGSKLFFTNSSAPPP